LFWFFKVMKITLRLSLLLNVSLLGCLAILLAQAQRKMPANVERQANATTPASQPTTRLAGVESSLSSPTELSKKFHWSQIESSDYRTYVANLRAIGCPEQTIRDIICADVDATFASRRTKLERTELTQTSPERALSNLRQEEAQIIETLLGPQTSSPRLSPAQQARKRALMRPATMPLVLQEVDLASLKLDKQRTQVIDELRGSFLEEIGGPNQDASDPAYRERWMKAQAESDDLLRGMIGLRAYQQYEFEAATRVVGGRAGQR
jgi:hypothetical protein